MTEVYFFFPSLLCIILFFLSFLPLSDSSKLFISFIFITILSTMVGYRDLSIGTDTLNYHDVYNRFEALSFSRQTNFEFIYELVLRICKILGFDFFQFQAVIAFSMFTLLIGSLKNLTKDYLFIFCIIIVSPSFFSLLVNIQRQGLSILAFMFSFSLYFSNKKTRSIVFFIVAILFHKSALLFSLVIFPIFHINKKLGFKVAISVGFLLIFSMSMISGIFIDLLKYLPFSNTGLRLFFSRVSTYTADDAAAAKMGIGILGDLLIVVSVMVLNYNLISRLNKVANLYLIVFVSVCLYIGFIKFEVLTRMSLFGSIFISVLLVYFPVSIRKIVYVLAFSLSMAKSIILF